MEARHDGNLLVRRDIDQTVGESAKPRAPKLAPYGLILERVLPDRGERRVNGINKLSAQPWTSLIIPVSRFGDLGFGLSPEYQFPIHL
jgi:hypothetical protein